MRRSPAREYIYTVVIIIICYLIISIFVPEMPGSVQCTERRVQRSVQCGVQALVSIDQQSEVGVHDGLICYQASQDTNNQDGPSPPGCLVTSPLILMIGEFIRSEFEIPFEDFRIILSFLCSKSN